MVGYVEGFEGSFCKIEVNGQIQNVSKENVDSHVGAGDVVEWLRGKWVTNKELTQKRTRQIKKLMDDVWED